MAGYVPVPHGAVIFAPDLREAAAVQQYKSDVIAKVRTLYPDALIGIGNAETDTGAYTDERMLSIMVDDGKNRRFRPQAIVLRTWSRIRQFFDANDGLLSSPARLRKLVSQGGLILYPQQPIAPAGT